MLSKAKWIKSPENNKEACYEFYTELCVNKKVKKATLSVTAMGMYCAYINGHRVGNEIFTPYWTEYSRRIQYQTYDVTEMIEELSMLNIVCAEGWAVGELWTGPDWRNHYAEHISLIFSLDIIFYDDTSMCINSNEDIRVKTSQILKASIYHGEVVDKTAEARALGYALCDESVNTKLVAQQGEKVIEQDVINPQKLIITPKGEKVIDFGQNLAGYVEIKIEGNRGDEIEISHAEILDKDGNFYTYNLRLAKQKNTYILSGKGKEIFKPNFSWQGFRYIRLDKYPFDEVDLSCFKAVTVHSDIKRTGNFICGNAKINQLYHNIVWSQKSNFIDVPTDNCQRNERLGWTGDAQLFVRTAAINFDVEKFFEKWLADLAISQMSHGGTQWIVPSCNLSFLENVSAGWGDAATICPWEIYMAYGNKRMLENQFDSMKKWVQYIREFGDEEYLWIGGKQFGDWLATDAEELVYKGSTSFDYISSAYYAYSTSLLIKAGKVLGYDMTEYEMLYENIVKVFQERFMKDGIPAEYTQTAYAMALYFNLCTDKQKTADVLAEMVRNNENKLTTGILGTRYLLYALSDNGYVNVAFDLLFQEENPSWLFSVNKGATTIWEHWDGIKEDGTLCDPNMNSFNQYAFGNVYDWIFGVAAGIKVLEDGAGYKHIQIKPHIDERFGDFLKAKINSRCGEISSHWYYREDKVYFEFEIPEKTVAEIILPDGRYDTVSGGSYLYSV